MGYVIKDDAAIQIVESVKSVASGRHFVSPQLTGLLVARHAQAGAAAERTPGIEALTETERKVLRLLAEFKTPRRSRRHSRSARARSIGIVEHGQKLGLNGTHALTKFADAHSSNL